MINPFLKRATEYYRDNEAFLALVSPEPVRYFLAGEGQADRLYDRLVVISGTPGSGKTTLARLFEYPTISTLLRHSNMDAYGPLLTALTECRAVIAGTPNVIGYRLPLEAEYRDFWEFDYPRELKLGLMATMIQARAVLGWLRGLRATGIDLGKIQIVPRSDAEAATKAIGGTQAKSVLEKARAIESSLYEIVSSLVAPEISRLRRDATSAYHPFDVIDSFEVAVEHEIAEHPMQLRPLIMLDDAHVLHPTQFHYLQRWLMRRELQVARWVLTRLDVLHPGEVLAAVSEDSSQKADLPGITKTRDVIEISLQSVLKGHDARFQRRKSFHKMAKDMANRYLRRMPLFSERNLNSLSDLLMGDPESIPPGKCRDLKANVDSAKKNLGIKDSRYEELLKEVQTYLKGKINAEDICLAMTRILMHRYFGRTPQRVLFGENEDLDPSKPLRANVSVYDAACIHLFHQYNKPFYFGIDDLCNASSENAEQFLHLSATLVETAAAQLIRSRPAALSVRTQNRVLCQKAEEIVENWNFPECNAVKRLTDKMAEKCLSITLKPNAPLGAGANAFGIPQDEFDLLPKLYEDLARVLQFAIAYNALSIVPRYPCKKQRWCLLELGGTIVLKHGLTLKRGGFIESTANELMSMIRGINR